MSSGQIRMTPDQMNSRATDYRTEAGNVEDVISRMDTLVDNLMDEWEGSASEAYYNRYHGDLRNSFVAAVDLIHEIADALDAAAKVVSETDQAISQQLSK